MKADQRQEEEEKFSFLNIHAWKMMSHCKEISDVHLLNCYKAQEKSKFSPLKATKELQNQLFCRCLFHAFTLVC